MYSLLRHHKEFSSEQQSKKQGSNGNRNVKKKKKKIIRVRTLPLRVRTEYKYVLVRTAPLYMADGMAGQNVSRLVRDSTDPSDLRTYCPCCK
jgi:hypothetical protein